MTLMAKGAELLPNAPVRGFVQRTPACGMTGEDSARAIDHSAREAGDPIVNQLEADKKPEHGQDHGAVLGHPVLQAVEQQARTLPHGEIDQHRGTDAGRRHQDEDHIRHDLLTQREGSIR